MNNRDNTNHCVMIDKDGSYSEMRMQKSGGCILMVVFGVLVIAALVTIIVMQSKMLKCLQKNGSKKK